MENWNPLKEDFNDSNFNSYNKGPGRNLPKSDSVRSGVQLYVTGIPVNLKPEGLRNLFCQAGRVTHVKILPTKIPGSLDTFGFITMASVKEATDALTRFHGFQIDRFRLKVQPCQTPEEQNRRKRIKEQDEAFLSTLNCGKVNPLAANKSSDDTDDEHQTKKPSMNGVNKDEQLTEKLGKGRGRGSMINSQDISVLDQSIVSHGPPSSSINSSIDSLVDLTITVGNQHRQVCVDPDTVRRGSADAGRSSRMSYAGSECSYSGRGVQTNVFRGRGYNRFNSSSPQFIPGPSGDRLHHTMPQIQAPKSGKECLYCRKKAIKMCTRCKMPYCSSACQAAHWPKHKTSCSEISTMPKEIDVEDFEVSIGEDIVEYFPPKDRAAIQQEYGDKIKTAYQKDQQVLETTESIKPLKHSSPKKKKANSPRKPSGPVVEAPLLSDLPKLDLELNKDISTIVTHIDSPDSFFVCLTEDIEKSFSVDEKLKTAMTTCIKGVPSYGQLFACNFSEMWCRCKVLSASSPEQVKIAYLDFGNCETVPTQRLFPLPPTMTNFYALAIRCKIDGIVPVDATVGWPGECLTRFLQPNTLCTIHIVKRERMLFFVKVKDANGNDVAKQLIKAKIATTIGASKIMVKDVPKVIQSLTQEQKLQVFVVLATSPEDFIVQIDERSHRATLEAFTSELDKSCQMDKQPLYRPDVGEMVSCKYEDGHWYRGDVIRVTNAAAVVYFIDFGNESEIPLSNIRPSLIEHAEYPAQAIKCSLHGIRDIRAQNEVKVDDCFSELSLKLGCRYQAQIKQIQDKIVVLDLYDKSDRLVTEILSKYVEKLSAPPKAPSKLQSEIEREVLKVGETFSAKLQCFISGTEFYILKTSRFQELGQLLREINEHCVKSTESYSPCVGEYVYALYLGDWYRAKVISVNNENISVYFVDYGNCHEDTSATIRKMLPEHLKFPGQAIKCCFDGVDRPLDDETRQTVEHILHKNPEFNVKVVSTANEACKIQVILAQGQCLNEAILSLNEENSAAQEESAISNKTLSEDRSGLSQNNVTIPRCTFPTDGSTVFCKLTFASDHEFCVSNIENAKQEAKFFQEINQHCASSKQNYIPTLGEYVYALYEGFWFRARVLVVSETNFSVYFVDYGNSVAVKSAEIREILPEHLELPCQAVKCRFDGIDSPLDDKTKEVVEGFLQDPSNSPFKVQVVSTEKDVHKVRVMLSDGQCLNDALEVLCKDAKTAADNQEDADTKETPTVKSPVSTKILNVILPTDGSDITCIFTTFVSNREFCVSKAKDKPQEEKLLQEINQHCSSSTECHTPSVGEYVYAVFEGVWYRAKVLETDNESYSVYYVDYGNSNKVTSTQIRKILPEHLELPCQAVKCCFDGIDSPLDNDSKQTIEGILQDPAQPLFNVRAISIVNGVHRVKVTIQNGTCINDALIAMMEETTSLPTDTPQPAQPQETSPTSSREQNVKSAEMARITNSTLPTDGSEIACIFTTFVSNSEFCVSKAEDKPQEGKLLQEINLHCTSSTEHYTPSVGEFVYAMFEGAWYRAKVLETDNESYSVYYVDYGNSNKVTSTQIRKILPEHLELPCQAVKCCFDGIDSPLDNDSKQTIEGILQDPAQPLFNVRAISIVNGVHRVKVTIQNGTCINDALIAMMEETTSLPTDTPQPAQPQETSPTSSREQNVKSAEMARITNSTLPTDGSEIACIFTTFVSNSEFCVSKAEDKPQEGKLLQEINLHCTSSTEHYTPSVGEFVYAMFEGAWYRAEVLETDNLNYSVCFVDYGNYSTVKSDQIRKLVPKHMELPCQAVKCSFSGVDLPLDDEMRQVIKGLLQDPTQFPFNVQATSVSDNIHKVKIITKDGTNINDALIAMMVDPSQSGESPPLVSQEKTKAVAIPDSVLPLDGTEIGCTFTTFISNGEFGLSRPENKTLEIQLLKEINVHCASTTEHYTPAVEEFVYALFEGTWNRAKVLGANKEKFSVYFVDHGNSVDVSSAEIRKILPEHLELPCLVVKCCFDGIDAPLDEECRQLIGGIMQDPKQSPFNVRAASVVNNVYKVKITTKNGTCINDALMALMDETASSVADAQDMKKQDGPPSLSSQDKAGKSTDMNTIPNSVLPTDGSEIACTFISFLSNSEFCVSKAEDKPNEFKLFQEINQHCSASSEHYSPSAGEFIYAMFEGDWYRAKVLATDNGIFSVYFVDYGNSNKVTRAQIRKLMPEHFELPCQAVKCCFDGVQAPLDDKTRQTIESVLQDPNESPFKVQVVSLMNDVHKVRIVISDGQCLNDVLKAIGTKAETHEEAYDIPKGITAAPLSPKDSKEKHTIADKLQETFKTMNIPDCDTPVDVTTDVTCLFTTFISDKVFCVSLFKNLSLSLHLHKEIKDHCSEVTQSYSPCEGENVYALYLGDWYRAKVLSVKDDNVSVYFVDYGNCIEVTSAEIRKILPNHLEFPSQAIKCTLDGFSKSFDNKSKHSVETLLCQGQFSVRFMSKEKDVYRVRITLNNGSCLSSILEKDISSEKVKSTNTKELPRLDYPTDGSSFEAMFTSRISESTFCILKVEEINNLSHVMQQVTSHCTTSHKVYKGSVGDYVCAKFESDGIWYRAKINNVMYDKYEVLFIDYGNVDNVSLENIREMTQELRSYPAQAILCSLAGVKEIKSKTFDQEMAAQTLFVEVLSVTDGINQVKVVLEDGTCVNDNYTEQTLPPSPSNDPSINLPNDTPSRFKQLASPSNDPTMTLSKDNPVEFEIQHIDSMTDFYIHVAHENVKKAVRRIEEELQELCKGTDVYNPVVGEYVCCFFEGLWYRALVLNVVNQLYTVKLVDYGNTTDIPLECIRKFNTELASLHPIACRCCLDNITQDDLVKFAEFLSTDHNTKIKLVSTEEDMNMVEIILSDGSSLNEKFRSSVTEPMSSRVRTPVAEQTSSPVDSPATVVQDRARFTLNDISFILPGDSELRAIFTAVTDPDNIYCHSATDAGAEAMSLLTQLSSKIADYCEKSMMDIEPRVNELYCGKQVDDWYRCLVIKLLSNQKVLVRYIDIGEEAEIPISDLRPFLPEFLSLPVTVFNCAVSGVKPIGEKWGTGAARLINSYGGETNTLRVVRRDGDRLICDVITSRGVNIKKELIQQYLGVEAEEEETNVEDDEEAIIRRQIAELQAKLASKSKNQKS